MNKIFLFLALWITQPVCSQRVFHLPAAFERTNNLGLKISEFLYPIPDPSGFVYNTADSGCKIFPYYYQLTLLSGKLTEGTINMIACKKDSGYTVAVDLNDNRNFTDDSATFLLPDHKHNKYPFEIAVTDGERTYKIPFALNLMQMSVTDKNGEPGKWRTYLTLQHQNSISATLGIGGHQYSVEAIPGRLASLPGKVSIGFSRPDQPVSKMNVGENNMPHRIVTDTIISGPYRFVIDSVDFIRNIISLTAWPMTDKDYGYEASARIRDYRLRALNDTGSRFKLSENFNEKSWLLVDFWGSWCEPCIKGMPSLVNLSDKLRGKVNVIGIACENDNDTHRALKILSEKKARYKNYFLSFTRTGDKKVLNEMEILAYPTYILLDRNLKIIMRKTNEEGLNEIREFVKTH
ncbi:MAG: TlpA family protein disulfide reductase [Chitinophagaceae bacterium]|nr:TlpA family protein disulfide reductase [Chitinophagaceae bacterium]